jgi:hypothetical protein
VLALNLDRFTHTHTGVFRPFESECLDVALKYMTFLNPFQPIIH